ncbi:plastocyanin/azurin family copper-binding protein [Pontibacter kalidii]|uniref:plastocyanin/azurin family copper-binding protein n=1 Tax=Pontibacter kalidii TaxID=2592049 RepID=UPI002253F070|nr:plastocyanin/azurin family copper-binding protein [Pontibacter kalidii]
MKNLKLGLLPTSLYFLCLFLFGATFSPAPPKVHTVEISQMRFNPDTLVVSKGDTIVFVNKDLVTHDVTEVSGKSWKSPALTSGDTWRMVALKTTDYFCSYHPVMKGKIEVK